MIKKIIIQLINQTYLEILLEDNNNCIFLEGEGSWKYLDGNEMSGL